MSYSLCPQCESSHIVCNGFSSQVACISGRKRQRFLCKDCKHRFSSNRYCMNYGLRKRDLALNAKIFHLYIRGLSERQIARFFKISQDCVSGRLERLARRALAFHKEQSGPHRIEEAVAYDGLENFAGSQYDPNNINHAIGAESLFVYDFNFAGLNRKGRISKHQRAQNIKIEADLGRYNPRGIRLASKMIFNRLLKRCSFLELLSDEHFQYRKAIEEMEKASTQKLRLRHGTVNSKAYRNFQNILFSVNHMDSLLRQRLACFARETISFSKKAGKMCQKYGLFMVYKNYMSAQFTKKHIRRPTAHIQSPAELAGVCHRMLGFGDIFGKLSLHRDVKEWDTDWLSFWKGEIPEEFQRSLRFIKKKKNFA